LPSLRRVPFFLWKGQELNSGGCNVHDEEIHKFFKNELDHQLDDFPHAIAGTNNKKELRKMKQYKLSNIFLWIKKYDFFLIL
jgi:hypothetical protein